MLRSRVSGYLRCALSTGAALVALLPAAIAPAAEGIDAKGEVTRVQFRRSARDAESDDWLYRGIETLQPGNSSSAIRRKAIGELPLDRLRPEARARAELILKDVGLFRRLPALQFEVDPEVYRYFLEHPDVAVGTWRAMEISKFELKPTRSGVYHADAGDGSVGEVEVFYRTPGDTLIACDGAFKSPLLARPIVARALIRVQTEFHREMDGRVIAVQNGDLFVQFPSTTIETVAKIISPVSHSIADRNFKQITLFMYMMSQATGKQPGWVEAIGRRLDQISEEERVKFLEMAAQAYVTARRRELTANEPDRSFSVDEILAPLRQSSSVDPMGTAVIRAASGEIPMNLPGQSRR
jgi:hypothetical protein